MADISEKVISKETELAALQSTCSRLQTELNALAAEPADADLDRFVSFRVVAILLCLIFVVIIIIPSAAE